MALIIAQRLSEDLGQQVVVDNRPGAGATLASDLVAKSAPDGYTLFMTPSAYALSPTLYRKLPFDPVGLRVDRADGHRAPVQPVAAAKPATLGALVPIPISYGAKVAIRMR